MSISGYTFLSIVQAKDVETGEVKAEMDYPALLESVRASIAQNHAKELAAALDDAMAAERLQTLILKYTAEQLAGHDFDREEMTRRIYEDISYSSPARCWNGKPVHPMYAWRGSVCPNNKYSPS